MANMLAASANTLAARHADLEAKLATEESRPNPDTGVIASLKKAKLLIKDALHTP